MGRPVSSTIAVPMVDRLHRPVGPTGLRGRATECALLDDLVMAIGQGESRSLVLRGEAGMGKTALLEHLIASASDLTVVRAAGVDSEMELVYAGLHQLCGPLLERLDQLPPPQREALEVVFGLTAGGVPDRFLVGLAVLSLFAEASEEQPLLCVVDDAQWLDQASALTLAFVARRLLAEPVAIVFAAREPGEELRHLPELEVHGVHNGDARALLASAVKLKLDERVRDRIIAETRGNPLALLELPRGLTAAQLAGGFGLLDAQPLSGRIEESFVQRLQALDEDERRLVLLAAAEPIGDPLLMWRAAERLGIGPGAAAAAEADGLFAIDVRVAFRHPLVRSAVYRSASAPDRRAVHLALAEATDRESDPDRRAWHLAAAAGGPDEQVATELELSAGRARARGGLSAAAAFLQRAVVLSRDPVQRVRRALAAAQANLDAGAFHEAVVLLSTVDAGALDELQAARAELLRGKIAFASSMGSAAPALLLKAAKRLERLDAGLARETYLDAWGAAMFAGRLATEGDLLEVSRAARSAPPPADPRSASDLLLDSLSTLITEGVAASAELLRRATSAFRDDASPENFRWGWMATIPPNVLWDEDGWDAISSRQVKDARDAGALARLPIDLNAWAGIAAWRGEFRAADAAIAEAHAVTEATGTGFAPYAALLLAALRGREADATAMIESVMRDAGAGGQGIGVQWGEWLNAVLYNGLGRYSRALKSARRATEEMPQLFVALWALPEQVEAAVRAGDPGPAGAALEPLAEATAASGTEWGLGIYARSRALMSEGDAAESSYREAIERLGRTRLRPELARAHLLYGEWLRRERRRVDAREQLRTAHEMLVAIGMEAFAERARKELQATGESARKRTVETRDDLTVQERHIARLARDGLTNPEIGTRLFLSTRTVEWHLHNVFSKLDIRSRHELPEADSQLAPA
jgi:DNA-binding CsgD family transcriptional regulator/tetratricopeptide (TPR) repeat protein